MSKKNRKKAAKLPAETAAPQQPVNAESHTAFAERLNEIGSAFRDMPVDSAFRAFMRAGGGNGLFLGMPDVQNRRVKAINTLPADYSKDKIAEMVTAPEDNERGLRAVSAALASSTKTYDLILSTYADMMCYFWYIAPGFNLKNAEKTAKMREWALAYKIAETMKVQAKAHEIAGLCMKYGKTFWTPRVSVDKSHNKVNWAYLQQLPTDWCKISGFNNGPGKYTVEFNLMYFNYPGTDWRQFGNLFRPYIDAFEQVVETREKIVYQSAKPKVNVEKFKALDIQNTPGHPKWENIGGEWMYWITLPADAVVVFEVDDRTVDNVPPTTGLMVSMTQIPNYEAAQMEIVLNPLTAVMTGSLETTDTKGLSTNADPIRVSATVRKMFEALWYQMLEANNTSGIGLFLAPAKEMKLQTLSDTVANTDITSTALSDQIVKAGLPAVVPTTKEPKVGVAQLSAAILANYARPIYWGFERMMDWIFEEVGFETPMRFRMFGNVFDKQKDLENARKGMTLGILHDTLRYDAICGISPLEDIAISDIIDESGLLDKRKPLVSSYTAKQSDSNLPPQAKKDLDPGGRPSEDGSINSEVTEAIKELSAKIDEML